MGIIKDIKRLENSKIEKINNITYIRNTFWTLKQRQGSKIHSISYRACFKPQLPEFFIDRLTKPGDFVYDPFMGRGTTLIQSMLMNRNPVGNDINPISLMLTRPRLNPPGLYEVIERLKEVKLNKHEIDDENLLVFYHKDVIMNLISFKEYFKNKIKNNKFDHVDDWIRMIIMDRLTGISKSSFSIWTIPGQTATVAIQKRINKKYNLKAEKRDVKNIIIRKSKKLLSTRILETSLIEDDININIKSLIKCGPADNAVFINDNSIDLAVTSPPFLNIVRYKSDNWIRGWFANIDLNDVNIAEYSKIEEWESFIHNVLKDLSRVVKPKKYIAFEVGEVRKKTIKLDDHVIAAADGLPLKVLAVMIHEGNYSKVSHLWGIKNQKKGVNSNRIVILQKN